MTNTERLTAKGLMHLKRGTYASAIKKFQQVAALSPHDPSIDFYLGEAYRLGGNHAEALVNYQRAASKQFKHPEFLMRKAYTHSALGQLEQAAASYREVLAVKPDFLSALYNLANVTSRLGDNGAAIALYEATLERDPSFTLAQKNLGMLYFSEQRWHEAVRVLQRAADLDPTDGIIAERMAIALSETHQTDRAIETYREILHRDPANAVAMTNLGNLYYNLGRTQEAHDQFVRLAAQQPTSAVYQLHLGIALYSLDRHAEAAVALERARELSAECPMARSVGIETIVGRIDLYLGMSQLLQGNLAEGWDAYENRWHTLEPMPKALQQTRATRWCGEDISNKRLTIFREQGIGDEIMFASLFSDAIKRAQRCVIQCNSRLHPAFKRSFPDVDILPALEDPQEWVALAEQLTEDDYWIFAGSLPRLLRRDLDNFPKHTGYLKADEQTRRRWRGRLDDLGPGLKVGVSWAGGTLQNGSISRSIPLTQLEAVLGIDGVVPVSLQYGDCAQEIADFENNSGIEIIHWQAAIDDYDATIGLVAALDLVISVQTALVHTAGALNQQTWVMLPKAQTNWRWFGHRDDCAWYPSVRFFHQQAVGDWTHVITSVEKALRELIAKKV